MDRISEALLSRPVVGLNLAPGPDGTPTLGAQPGQAARLLARQEGDPTLWVLLRHTG